MDVRGKGQDKAHMDCGVEAHMEAMLAACGAWSCATVDRWINLLPVLHLRFSRAASFGGFCDLSSLAAPGPIRHHRAETQVAPSTEAVQTAHHLMRNVLYTPGSGA